MNPIRRFLAGGSLGLALCAPNYAADPAPPLAVQLDRLRDGDYRVRESAARELIRLDRIDRGARSAVWFLAGSPDPDLSQRANKILRAIERDRLQREFATAPAVRLKFADVPISVALADVERQTGVRLREYPGDIADHSRRVTVDTGELPYWHALGTFLEAAGLSIRPCTGIAPPTVRPAAGPDSTPLPTSPLVVEGLPPLPGLAAFGIGPDPTLSLLTHAALHVGDKLDAARPPTAREPILVRAVAAGHPGLRRSADGVLTVPLEVLRCGTLAGAEIEEIFVERAIDERGRPLFRQPPPVEEPAEVPQLWFAVANAPPLGIPVSRPSVPHAADNPLIPIHLGDTRTGSRRLARLEGSVLVRVSSVQSILELPLSVGMDSRVLGRGGDRSIELMEVVRLDADTIRVEVRSVELTPAAPAPVRGLPVGLRAEGISGLKRTPDAVEPPIPVVFRNRADEPVEPLSEYRRDGAVDGLAERSYRFEISTRGGEVRMHLRGTVTGTIMIPFALKDVDLP